MRIETANVEPRDSWQVGKSGLCELVTEHLNAIVIRELAISPHRIGLNAVLTP
jgi:hypothetical protein